MNDDDDFVELLRNREIARADQREAHYKTAEDQARIQQMIRERARSTFDEMRSCAEGLVEQANAKLTETFMILQVPGGFGIGLSNKTASFTYAPPFFANEGLPCVIVTFQSLASSFGFFRDAYDEDESRIEKLELEPTLETRTNSVMWRVGGSIYSSTDIVQGAMEKLQG